MSPDQGTLPPHPKYTRPTQGGRLGEAHLFRVTPAVPSLRPNLIKQEIGACHLVRVPLLFPRPDLAQVPPPPLCPSLPSPPQTGSEENIPSKQNQDITNHPTIPPLPLNRITDICENINFPRTTYMVGKKFLADDHCKMFIIVNRITYLDLCSQNLPTNDRNHSDCDHTVAMQLFSRSTAGCGLRYCATSRGRTKLSVDNF